MASDDKTNENAAQGEMPKVDFSTLVLSLGTTALYQLGAVPDPGTALLAGLMALPAAEIWWPGNVWHAGS